MNFLTIHYFLTLVEERNFTRAAERLHVTQQTLSGHIAMVEREVGMKLFIRHVPLELTDGGEVFYRYARIFQRNELAFRRSLSCHSLRCDEPGFHEYLQTWDSPYKKMAACHA